MRVRMQRTQTGVDAPAPVPHGVSQKVTPSAAEAIASLNRSMKRFITEMAHGGPSLSPSPSPLLSLSLSLLLLLSSSLLLLLVRPVPGLANAGVVRCSTSRPATRAKMISFCVCMTNSFVSIPLW